MIRSVTTGFILAMLSASPTLAGVSAVLVQNDLSYSGKPMTVGGFSPHSPVLSISGGDTYGNGIVFDAESRLLANEIYFKNSIIGSGRTTSMLATIGVAITVTNDYGIDFRPELRTKILAAGMGMFFALPIFESRSATTGQQVPLTTLDCTPQQLKNCSPADAPQLALTNEPVSLFRSSDAGFIFDVSIGGNSIKRLSSSVGYDADGVYFEDIADAQSLNGFQSTTGGNPNGFLASGYSWQDTFIDIAFPDMLGVGDSVTAIYTISTFINLGGDSVPALTSTAHPDGRPLIVTRQPGAFAAFGDPIGGGSTIDDLRAGTDSALLSTDELTRFNTNGTGVFSLPTLVVDEQTGIGRVLLDGETRFLPRDPYPYGRPDGAVPEPSVWALLVIGFGFVGGALRRRVAAAA